MFRLKMNKPVYTHKELQGKFVVFTLLLSGPSPVMEPIRYASGLRADKPYLYDSIEQAKSDLFFSPEDDKIIPASEYFRRVAS